MTSNLDFAMSASFSGVHESGWGFLTDGMIVKLSGGDGAGPASEIDVDITTAFGTFAPTYRLVNTDCGALSVYAGGRVTYSKTKLDFTGGQFDGRGVDDDYTWVDAVIGLQGRWFLTDKLFLAGMADVGGGSSDLNWQVLAGVGYQFTDRIDVRIAYRYMYVDYASGDFVYDIETQGLAFGLGIRW